MFDFEKENIFTSYSDLGDLNLGDGCVHFCPFLRWGVWNTDFYRNFHRKWIKIEKYIYQLYKSEQIFRTPTSHCWSSMVSEAIISN